MGKKATGRARSMPAGLAIGAAVSTGITILLCAVGAMLIDREMLGENTIGYIAMVTLLAASYIGGLTAAGAIKHRYAAVCGAAALIYYGILIGMNALFFDGIYRGMGVTALLVGCGCTLSLLTVQRKGRGGRAKKRYKVPNR